MDSSLRERFARLGPIRNAGRISSGSPGRFVLRPAADRAGVKAVDAVLILTRRGVTMLSAKRDVGTCWTWDGPSSMRLRSSPAVLATELAAAGIAAAPVEPPGAIDVQALRERLGLTRAQFAARYGLQLETLRNWEIGRWEPDTTARSYLRVIDADPERVARAYRQMPGG